MSTYYRCARWLVIKVYALTIMLMFPIGIALLFTSDRSNMLWFLIPTLIPKVVLQKIAEIPTAIVMHLMHPDEIGKKLYATLFISMLISNLVVFASTTISLKLYIWRFPNMSHKLLVAAFAFVTAFYNWVAIANQTITRDGNFYTNLFIINHKPVIAPALITTSLASIAFLVCICLSASSIYNINNLILLYALALILTFPFQLHLNATALNSQT